MLADVFNILKLYRGEKYINTYNTGKQHALDIPNLKKNKKYRKYLIIAILKHFRGFEKNTNILIILGNP